MLNGGFSEGPLNKLYLAEFSQLILWGGVSQIQLFFAKIKKEHFVIAGLS